MFIALNESNERISIDKADKTHRYFCPVCGEILSIKAIDSLAVKAHFAHKRGTECLDTWKHDMSEWHYNWQCLFPEANREIVVEKDGVKHRADVLINNFVIEFQHSPITAEEITERNNFYLSCGYTVVWVFDAEGKIKNTYREDNNIEPFSNDLEWKRARREFNIKTPEKVCIFIEYTANIITNPPQQADIMLFLEKFSPKEIHFRDTRPMYITRGNFLKEYGVHVPDDILSIKDIFNENKEFIASLKRTRQGTIMIVPKRNKRHCRF